MKGPRPESIRRDTRWDPDNVQPTGSPLRTAICVRIVTENPQKIFPDPWDQNGPAVFDPGGGVPSAIVSKM